MYVQLCNETFWWTCRSDTRLRDTRKSGNDGASPTIYVTDLKFSKNLTEGSSKIVQ